MKELMQNLLKLQALDFDETGGKKTGALKAELRGKIPPQILVHYDRLRAHGKKGIAAVRNQVCTACHMRLPLGVIMTLKHGVDIQLCDTCGRYLYLEEIVPQAEPAPVKPAAKTRKRKAAAPAA